MRPENDEAETEARVSNVQEMSQKLFQQFTHNNSYCLCYLIPVVRDSSIADRLRSANKFPVIFARTNKFKIRLYATPSPTTNDCDSYFIV